MVREFKHTEIGDIPIDWKLQTFEETFQILSNNTLSRDNLNNRGGAVRNIHYGDILTKYNDVLDCNIDEIPFINDLSLLTASTQLLQDGDIIIADTAEDDTVGKAIEIYGLGESKMVAGLHTIPCRVKKGNFAPKWLGYYMNSFIYHNQILPFITGIKVSSISKSSIEETLIAIPPIAEQQKIIDSLAEINSLIFAEEKMIAKIEAIKKGCLSNLFPQKWNSQPLIRMPEFKNSPCWKMRQIGSFTNVSSAARVHKDEWKNSGVPFFRSSDVVSAFKGTSNEKAFISQELYEELIKISGKIEQGDILITGGGSIGIPYIVADNSPLYSKDADLIWVKNSKEYDSRYLYAYFTCPAFRSYISSISHVGTIAHYTIEQVKTTPVLLPELAEQRAIADFFEALDRLDSGHRLKIKKLYSLKAGMISELITGKICIA